MKPPTNPRVSLALPLAIGAILLAHLAASFVPNVRTWGIDYWSEIPVWARVLVLGFALLCLIPSLGAAISQRLQDWQPKKWQLWASLLVLVVLFVVFRSQGFAYGDGYSFRGYFIGDALPSLSGHLRVMTGDVLVHWAIIRVTGLSPDFAYALISAIAGAVSLLAIFRIAKALFPKDRTEIWLVIAGGCSSAMVILWFGYVEAYSLVNVALLWTLAFLIEGKSGSAWLMWMVAVFFHLLALALLPLLLLASIGRRLLDRKLKPPMVWLLFAAGFVLSGLATVIASTAAPGIFVPIASTSRSTYTAFSIAHLLDMLNLFIFAAPLGVIALIVSWGSKGEERLSKSGRGLVILGLASASLVYFAFWIDPLIGMFRDWDLLGAFGIPLSLFGAALLDRRYSSLDRWVSIAGLTVAHALALVATVQNESTAMLRVDRMVRADIHYSEHFHRGERRTAWAYVMAHIAERYDISLDHLGRRLVWEPLDMQVSRNMGGIYWTLGKLDSAQFHFEQAVRLNPGDTAILNQLGRTYMRMKKWGDMVRVYDSLAILRPLSVEEINSLAFAHISKGEHALAESMIATSLRIQPDQQEAYYYRGSIAEMRGDLKRAVADYERAIGPGTPIEDVYSRATRLYNSLVQWSDMTRIARMWTQRFPQSAAAHFMLGLGYSGQLEHQQANAAYLRSIQFAPTSVMAHFGAGVSYRHLGEPTKALASLRMAASLDSTLALPYLEMVYLAADADDRPAAVSATHEFLKRSPGDSAMDYLDQFRQP